MLGTFGKYYRVSLEDDVSQVVSRISKSRLDKRLRRLSELGSVFMTSHAAYNECLCLTNVINQAAGKTVTYITWNALLLVRKQTDVFARTSLRWPEYLGSNYLNQCILLRCTECRKFPGSPFGQRSGSIDFPPYCFDLVCKFWLSPGNVCMW